MATQTRRKFVLVRNAQGLEMPLSQRAWELLAKPNEQGDTRQGITLIRSLGEHPTLGSAQKEAMAVQVPLPGKASTPAYKPQELAERRTSAAQDKANEKSAEVPAVAVPVEAIAAAPEPEEPFKLATAPVTAKRGGRRTHTPPPAPSAPAPAAEPITEAGDPPNLTDSNGTEA